MLLKWFVAEAASLDGNHARIACQDSGPQAAVIPFGQRNLSLDTGSSAHSPGGRTDLFGAEHTGQPGNVIVPKRLDRLARAVPLPTYQEQASILA